MERNTVMWQTADCRNIEKYEQGIGCDIRALNIREKIHLEKHSDVARSYHNLAVDYRNIGKPSTNKQKNVTERR